MFPVPAAAAGAESGIYTDMTEKPAPLGTGRKYKYFSQITYCCPDEDGGRRGRLRDAGRDPNEAGCSAGHLPPLRN